MSSIAAAIVLESKNCAACASLAPASAIVCTFCVCEFVHVYTHAHARTHTYAHTRTQPKKHTQRASERETERIRESKSERERERESKRESESERAREAEGRRERTHAHTHTHTHTQADRRTNISYLHHSKARHRARHAQSEERQVPNQNFPIGSRRQKMRAVGRKVHRKHRFAMPLEAEELLALSDVPDAARVVFRASSK